MEFFEAVRTVFGVAAVILLAILAAVLVIESWTILVTGWTANMEEWNRSTRRRYLQDFRYDMALVLKESLVKSKDANGPCDVRGIIELLEKQQGVSL